MDITKVVAKARLHYHLNMIDICNVANQLHLMSDDKADRANRDHLKNVFDCYGRLGVALPEYVKDFVNEKN